MKTTNFPRRKRARLEGVKARWELILSKVDEAFNSSKSKQKGKTKDSYVQYVREQIAVLDERIKQIV